MSVPVVFSTGSLFPFGLDRVYGWAAEAGYDGVEVMMDERWDTHQEDYLSALSGEHGVPVRALHPPLGSGAWRLEPGETLVRVARLARRLGAGAVVAHPPPPGRAQEAWSRGPLAEARKEGVSVAVENMPPRTVRRLPFLRRRPGSSYLPGHLAGLGDVTLDTSHVGAAGLELLEVFSELSGRLRHVHLSDSRMTGRDEHRVPGRGKLPLKELLAALGPSGYPGVVSLELKPWPLGAPDPREILARMQEALEFARDGLA